MSLNPNSIILSTGAVAEIHKSVQYSTPVIVQVINIKIVTRPPKPDIPSQDYYKLVVSDGYHIVNAMVASDNTQMIAKSGVGEFSIVKFREYVPTKLKPNTKEYDYDVISISAESINIILLTTMRCWSCKNDLENRYSFSSQQLRSSLH